LVNQKMLENNLKKWLKIKRETVGLNANCLLSPTS